MSSNKPALSASNIKKSFGNYGAFVVLKDVNLSIQQGERIGLVGPNGAGKTTLLKILAGLVIPEAGTVTVAKGIERGYIPQEFSEYLDLSALEFIETVISGEATVIRARLAPILARLRLDESILGRKLKELSGGEKTKIALMRILAAEQDCLLLDEPTNNLDISALQVLEDFVVKSGKTFLIISHDRAFLDATVNRIFEIDEFERTLRIYEGNYSAYSAERAAQIERDWKDYADKMQKDKQLEKAFDTKVSHIREIEKVRKGIRYLHPKLNDKPDDAKLRDKEARAGHRAKVMKNRLERFREQSEDITKPKELPPLKVHFESDERSGEKVFEAKGLVKKLPEHMFGPFNLDIRYGERILVTGENGTGKTTILKMLLGELAPDAGEIIRGSRLHIGYLPQQESLDPEATVREEFLKHIQVEESMGRKTLNRFKLDAGDVGKKIKELSSGERSRLILAILMARKVNCLVLDEPSNHLDIEVLESLEKALETFPGTIIVVSHDRYFIKRVRFTKTYEVKEGMVGEV